MLRHPISLESFLLVTIKYMEKLDYYFKAYAPVATRIALSLVFLWFGFDQALHTSDYIGYIPDSIVSLSGLSAGVLVHLNSVFELVFGSALLLGFFTRTAALLLALHLFDITFIVGFDQIGVRDFGLSMATLSVFLYGKDVLSLDRYITSEN